MHLFYQVAVETLISKGLRELIERLTLIFCVPGMGDDLAVEVRYRLGSRNC